MLVKKIIKTLKITYLIFAVLLTIAMLFEVPSFSTSSKDILIYRLSNFCFFAISFVLPAVFILLQSIRKKIPLFKKEKLIFTILGCSLLFVIGMIVYGGIDSFHSAEYNVAKSKYDTVIEAKKVEVNKIKAEAKAQAKAEAKAKEEAEAKAREEADAKAREEADAKAKEEADTKAKEDAKAKEIADAKKVAEDKTKTDADAKAKADAEVQAKADAEVQAKADAEVQAKAIADAKVKAEKDFDDWVNSQFSPWDGSNYNLVDLIKQNMNDPKSFEHIETTQSIEKGKGITLYMKYRGRNAFGGLIINTVEAYADYNTQVLQVTKVN
ncbi:hypothetical protein [Clostridium sp.]|uniref:hypothetical protein n=1 Tax=Clostridium sp. TaxID=1506 RepID=UPI0032170420